MYKQQQKITKSNTGRAARGRYGDRDNKLKDTGTETNVQEGNH